MPKVTDWELCACANHYVWRHGEDAPFIAARQAEELLVEGDPEGARAFESIVQRINHLLEEPAG